MVTARVTMRRVLHTQGDSRPGAPSSTAAGPRARMAACYQHGRGATRQSICGYILVARPRIPGPRARVSRADRRSTMSRSGTQTIDLTERNFDEALAASEGLVMVDFWAQWC